MSFATQAKRLKREHGHAAAGDIVVPVAADFLRGGEPTFARAFDHRGSLLLTLQRRESEGWEAFKTRARGEAGKVAGACSLLIGGLRDPDASVSDHTSRNLEVSPPRGAIILPEAALHPSQIEALELIRKH